jgi:SAM-dependent methyltransferase
MDSNHFTPALGRPGLTRAYDLAIRLLTRETVWRSEFLRQVAPHNNETIIDVGCGTGTFALMLKRAAPGARITAIDPDPHVLALARKKAEAAGIEIAWRQGFARDVAGLGGSYDKAVSSLVFHQVPLAGKREGVADYAHQSGALMRALFRLTVQGIDGLADTQPNADGALESILSDYDEAAVAPQAVVPTATGAISLFKAIKPFRN